jgi:hypothetical protein
MPAIGANTTGVSIAILPYCSAGWRPVVAVI